MSKFSNLADAGAEAGAAYVHAILDLLGTQEPLQVLDGLVKEIETRIEGLTLSQVKREETPGKWSILQVTKHLADSELVWAYRLRLVLAQDRPELTGYDQDLWASRLHYEETDLKDALELLRVVRRANLKLLRSLTTAELQKAGVHKERGEETVAHMIRLYAGHDLVHLRQITRICSSLASPDMQIKQRR